MTPAGNQAAEPGGLSPQEVRRFLREQFRRWADYDNEKPAGWLPEAWETKIDPRILDAAVVAIQQVGSDDESRRAARNALEPIIARGLERRAGRFIIPVMVVKPEMLSDWVAWETTRRAFEGVGREASDVRCALWGEHFHLVVCNACTAVFRPRRRAAQARRCHLCLRRPAEPAIGAPETLGPLVAGQPITIRVPERVGNVVTSWKIKTVMRCPECGATAFTRRGATTCGSKACESRRRRRSR